MVGVGGPQPGTATAPAGVPPAEARLRVALVALATALFAVSVLALAGVATSPLRVASLSLAYASGVSMVALPCTLPAVLVIVPLSLGRGARRGMAMAGLFGLGLTLTLGGYGAGVAWLGRILYLDTVTLVMWLVAAVAAYLFGVGELGLLALPLPAAGTPLPAVLQRRGDLVRAFGMGLLLGNAGIGCPNPAFYVLLTYLAASGSPATGVVYGLVHGLGRATPLLALSGVALLGVDATGWFLHRRERIQRATAWGLVAFGALLIPKGYLFGHAFWEESVFHKVWNGVVARVFGPNVAESAEVERMLGDMPVEDPWLLYGPWALVGALLALPVAWREWRAGGAAVPGPATRGATVAALLLWLWPRAAGAHGDDRLRPGSFLGPVVGALAFLAVVGAGRLLARAAGRR